MRDEGKRGATLVLRQIDAIDEYLSACQLGITMASLGIGFLGEPAIASLLEDMFGDSISHNLSLAISLTIAYLITTALHITRGRAGAEDLRDRARGAHGAACRARRSTGSASPSAR